MNLRGANRWNAYLQVRAIILAVSLLGLSSFGTLAGSVGSVASNSSQGDATWQRVHTKDEEFSIMMPTRLPMYIKENQYLGKVNRINVSQRVVSGYLGGFVFIVEMYDTANPQGLLNAYFDIVHHSKGDMSEIDFNGLRGIQYFKRQPGLYHRIQCFATKRRVYVVQVAGRREDMSYVNRFFSSLSISGMKARPDKDDSTQSDASSATDSSSPSSAPDTNNVFHEDEVTYKANTLFLPVPERPNSFRGSVKLKMVLSSSGEVRDISLPGGLDKSVGKYLSELATYMIFLPAERDGHAVSQYSELTFNFQ